MWYYINMEETCRVSGCNGVGRWNNIREKRYLSKGMCGLHYKRYYKYKDINKTKKVEDGRVNHPLYRTHMNMLNRCTNPNNPKYHRYGGRGIEVSERWSKYPEGFWNFVKDMGDRPEDTTLDRINNNGNYDRSNCRWATAQVQQSNKSVHKTGVPGVYIRKDTGAYVANLRIDGKRILEKSFHTMEEAREARAKALEIYAKDIR